MLDAENPAENAEATATPEADQAGNDLPETVQGDQTVAQAEATDSGATPAEPGTEAGPAPAEKAAKKAAAKKSAAKKATAKKTAAKRTTKKVAETPETEAEQPVPEAQGEVVPDAAPAPEGEGRAPAAKKTAKKATKKAATKRTTKKVAAPESPAPETEAGEVAAVEAAPESAEAAAPAPEETAPAAAAPSTEEGPAAAQGEESATQQASATSASATALLFQAPDPTKAVVTRRRRATRPEAPAVAEPDETARATETGGGEEPQKPAKKGGKKKGRAEEQPEAVEAEQAEKAEEAGEAAGPGEGEEEQAGERRRRRRGGRRRRRPGGGDENGSDESVEGSAGAGAETSEQAAEADEGEEGAPSGSRRRRRRRRSGESGEGNGEEAEAPVARARKPRNAEDEITAVTGSTRLEAKKQRRREGREAGRRRAPIVSEAEFLARRESVDRVMVIRQRQDLTQIAVLEDKVLVEHYVSRESQTSLIGNVYLGRVQNVLPSMEAAFIDIGKGRNAVLYAGEVNWDALGAKNGSPRKIEAVLKSGQTVLVQVTKDPIGHKGARLTSQISLPGRFLVYVPDGTTSGISRKLPDTERNRLKNLLKDIVPDTAGVIVRTAAEGASEEELTRDVERLTARWADIEKKAASGNAPQLLYGEPDLTLKVVRDLFTEDFKKLVIAGDEAWDMVQGYVSHVAPDLAERLERYDGERDVFAEYRIDEQIEKALDRKVWLPSGGSLVIDRTEAMTVVDVNTGKFTGSGGNLEETVTKNNLEAAEEIVRQLRLRDIGGIIVVDFIDMVLESNRDLVLRRLVECLGRDRTRHQVAEVTSLGLVQMTRKRIGTGLLEAFSETCEHCGGRGLLLHHEPVEPKKKGDEESRRGRRSGRGRGREETAASANGGVPSPKDIAAMARHEERPADTDGQEPPHEKAAEERPEPAGVEGAEGRPARAAASEETETAESRPSARSRGGRGRGRGRAARAEEPGEEQAGAPAQAKGDGEQPELFPAAQERGRAEQPEPEPVPAEQVRGGATETPTVEAAAHVAEPTPAGTEEPAADETVGAGQAGETSGRAGEDGAARKGAEEASPEAAPAEPAAAPAAPTVVTTVRRRSARRPAGPPTGAAAAGTAVQASATVTSASDESTPDDSIDEPADVDPLATLVDAAEEPPAVDGADADGNGPDTHATPHVPVKKRGSRRR